MAPSCNNLALSARHSNSNEIIATNGYEEPEKETLLKGRAADRPRIVAAQPDEQVFGYEPVRETFTVEEPPKKADPNKIDWSKGIFFAIVLVENRFLALT